MFIKLQRSGGLLGLQLSHQVDTKELDQPTAKRLDNLAQTALGLELPPPLPRIQSERRDTFKYTLVISENAETAPFQGHVIEVEDPDVPNSLQELIEWMGERATRDQAAWQ